jgi:hypothetical protein
VILTMGRIILRIRMRTWVGEVWLSLWAVLRLDLGLVIRLVLISTKTGLEHGWQDKVSKKTMEEANKKKMIGQMQAMKCFLIEIVII